MHARRRVNTGIIMFHSFIQVISIAPLQVHNTQYNTNQIYNARKVTPKCESEARSNADSPVGKRTYGNPIIRGEETGCSLLLRSTPDIKHNRKNSVVLNSLKLNFIRVAQKINATFHIDLISLCYI